MWPRRGPRVDRSRGEILYRVRVRYRHILTYSDTVHGLATRTLPSLLFTSGHAQPSRTSWTILDYLGTVMGTVYIPICAAHFPVLHMVPHHGTPGRSRSVPSRQSCQPHCSRESCKSKPRAPILPPATRPRSRERPVCTGHTPCCLVQHTHRAPPNPSPTPPTPQQPAAACARRRARARRIDPLDPHAAPHIERCRTHMPMHSAQRGWDAAPHVVSCRRGRLLPGSSRSGISAASRLHLGCRAPLVAASRLHLGCISVAPLPEDEPGLVVRPTRGSAHAAPLIELPPRR